MRIMSDSEIDREWKPSGRPQSTMALSFSAALNDVFKMDNSLADLDAAVEEKKKAVSSQASELEALEARLRATEERLRIQQSAIPNTKSSKGDDSSRQRTAQNSVAGDKTTEELSTVAGLSRPTTAKQQSSFTGANMPGALPPTPSASDDGEMTS